LESADVNYGHFLIYTEVIEGTRRPLVFGETIMEDFSLIGKTGTQIKVPTSTQLSATKITSTIETTLATGMSASDPSISATNVNVSVFIYCAITLSDILMEDYPNLDLFRRTLRNAGKAVMEQIDADIETAYAAGYGVLHTCSSISYDEVSDAIAKLENEDWYVSGAPNAMMPYLVISPDVAADLKQDTKFTETEQFYGPNSPERRKGVVGVYAGCRVLKTSLLNDTGRAYIIMPSNSEYGPVSVLAWKRRVRVKSERYENKEHTFVAVTARVAPTVIQSTGICRINITTTP
jgi:hypothetical protein